MKRFFTIIFCIVIIVMSPFSIASVKASTAQEEALWPDGPGVNADSAIIMDASTGLILYSKNIDEIHYPASITKIMTALIAIENSNMGEIVSFSKNAVFDVDLHSSRIGIDVGEQLTMQQCLYAILLESANEVSYAVAEHIAGDVDHFAEMMNEKAKALGCTNTHFINPHGLPDDDHYTTCHDMALITQAAMKNETFRKIFSTRTYEIPPTNIQTEARPLRNHHKFILRQDYTYDDCIGGKTGYTSVAKYTLVTVAKRGDLELISVIMHDDTNAHQYQDTQKLLDFGFDNFSIYPIADMETTPIINESPIFTRYNTLLSKENTPVEIDENGYLVLPNTASKETAKRKVTFSSAAKNDISETDTSDSSSKIIGKISYTYDGKYVGGANILYKEDPSSLQLVRKEVQKNNPTGVPENEPSENSDMNLRPIIFGCIIGLFILIIILYFILVERPRLKRKNAYYKKKALRKLYKDNDYLDL